MQLLAYSVLGVFLFVYVLIDLEMEFSLLGPWNWKVDI